MSEWSACPDCKLIGKLSKSTSRSFVERIINHSKYAAVYRCHVCGWRGIKFKTTKIKRTFLKVLGYVTLFLIIYFVTEYFIKLSL